MKLSYHAEVTCYFKILVQSEKKTGSDPHPLIYTVVLLDQQDLLCPQLEFFFVCFLGGFGVHIKTAF